MSKDYAEARRWYQKAANQGIRCQEGVEATVSWYGRKRRGKFGKELSDI